MSTPDEPIGTTGDDDLDSEGVGSIDIGPGTIDPREFRAGASPVQAEFYMAVLINEIVAESGDKQPLYEESFILLRAESSEEAREKARDHGKQQETSYHNENHELVHWKLKQVRTVTPVEDATFDDGTELYGRFFRDHTAYSQTFDDPADEEF